MDPRKHTLEVAWSDAGMGMVGDNWHGQRLERDYYIGGTYAKTETEREREREREREEREREKRERERERKRETARLTEGCNVHMDKVRDTWSFVAESAHRMTLQSGSAVLGQGNCGRDL